MKILIDAAAAYFYRNTGIGAYGTELLAALNEMDHGFRIDSKKSVLWGTCEDCKTP